MALEFSVTQALAGTMQMAGDLAATGMVVLAQVLPAYNQVLAQMLEVCTLCLAVAVLLLCRRVRRDRAAMRGLATELGYQRERFADFQRLQKRTEERLARLRTEIADLGGRQRGLEVRVGKPDPKLAAAMARAGTQRQQMVDCGLSHGEVNLLHAINAGKPAQVPNPAAISP